MTAESALTAVFGSVPAAKKKARKTKKAAKRDEETREILNPKS